MSNANAFRQTHHGGLMDNLTLLDNFTRGTDMTDQIQISVDQDIYERLQMLMVPPISDANAVIKELLFQEGHASPASVALEASGHHYTMAEELERTKLGIYDCGGAT